MIATIAELFFSDRGDRSDRSDHMETRLKACGHIKAVNFKTESLYRQWLHTSDS